MAVSIPSKKFANRKIVTDSDLLDILYEKYEFPKNSFDEVYPNVLLGDAAAAKNTLVLKEAGVTDILNTAGGTTSSILYIITGKKFYDDKKFPCNYLGLPMVDTDTFPISQYFHEGADFIEDALSKDGSRVLVHCRQGVSRSATIVIAYLMIKKQMSVIEACQLVRSSRAVLPNRGFLKQLCDLHASLWVERSQSQQQPQGTTSL